MTYEDLRPERDEYDNLPPDATCPGCHVLLTKANTIRRREAFDGSALVETDVPGVVEERDDIPVFVLMCVTCLTNNVKWRGE